MKLYGKTHTKEDILRHVGELSQLGGVKESTLSSGKGRGMRCIDVDTGAGLQFTLLPDRCLDIAWARYKTTPLGFITKAGVSSSVYFTHWNEELHRVFAGGLLTTGGLRNIGKFGDYEGEHFGQHGRISNAPAEDVAVNCGWQGDEYRMSFSGRMREAVLYEENLYLHRTIHTHMGATAFTIRDTITNLAFRTEAVDILYHMNFGYPLLSGGAAVRLPGGVYTDLATGQEKPVSALDTTIGPPKDDAPSLGFPIAFDDEDVCVELLNPSLDEMKGIRLRYKKSQLPRFALWKCEKSGDYVVGLEPGTSTPEGREANLKNGTMVMLKPMEEYTIEVTFEIIL